MKKNGRQKSDVGFRVGRCRKTPKYRDVSLHFTHGI